MPTRAQIANVLETLAGFSAVGIGLALGMTSFGEVLVTGVGLSLATDLIREGSRRLKERWVTSGILNHDVQRALARAFVNAVDALWDEYRLRVEAEHLRRGRRFLTRSEQRAIKTFVTRLQEEAEVVFVRSLSAGPQRGAFDEDLKTSLYEAPQRAVDRLWARLDRGQALAELHVSFQNFLHERLLDAVIFWFGEELKADTREGNRAWRAFQRLLLEGLRDDVKAVQAGQDAIRGDLRTLDAIAAQLDRLQGLVDHRLPDDQEPFQQGLKAAVDGIGKKLDEVRRRLEGIEYGLVRVQQHLGIDRPRLCFVTGPAGSARLRTLTETVVKPVLAGSDYAYEVEMSGYVDFDDLEKLEKADLVIADLTGSDPNVVYGLAVRHCVGRPDIVLREKEEDMADLPFKAHRMYTIVLDDVEQARRCLRQAVRELEQAYQQQNPVTAFFKAPLTEVSPAYGLALGYAWHFIIPVARILLDVREGVDAYVQVGDTLVEDRKRLEAARLSIVIPARLHQAARDWIERKLVRLQRLVEARVGNARRSFSRLHAFPDAGAPLVLMDVPTTMNVMTEAIEHRLGKQADRNGNAWLVYEQREIAHFVRSLHRVLSRFDEGIDYLGEGLVEIVPLHQRFPDVPV